MQPVEPSAFAYQLFILFAKDFVKWLFFSNFKSLEESFVYMVTVAISYSMKIINHLMSKWNNGQCLLWHFSVYIRAVLNRHFALFSWMWVLILTIQSNTIWTLPEMNVKQKYIFLASLGSILWDACVQFVFVKFFLASYRIWILQFLCYIQNIIGVLATGNSYCIKWSLERSMVHMQFHFTILPEYEWSVWHTVQHQNKYEVEILFSSSVYAVYSVPSLLYNVRRSYQDVGRITYYAVNYKFTRSRSLQKFWVW